MAPKTPERQGRPLMSLAELTGLRRTEVQPIIDDDLADFSLITPLKND
jgi:hypothetical protein